MSNFPVFVQTARNHNAGTYDIRVSDPLTRNLFEEAARRRLTQEFLEEKLGYSKKQINNYLSGKAAPTIYFVRDFADLLGYNLTVSKK